MSDKRLHPRVRPITWKRTEEAERSPEHYFVYKATVDGARWSIEVNDFPAEPLYTLLINGEYDQDFNEWPASWKRPLE